LRENLKANGPDDIINLFFKRRYGREVQKKNLCKDTACTNSKMINLEYVTLDMESTVAQQATDGY
jgi:hypothetical protein